MVYTLGENLKSLVDLLYALVGIWMAHSLYRTPRRWWQAALAWAMAIIFLSIVTTPVHELLPFISYEKTSTLLGFCCVLVYIYLFPNVPVAQRIFTYFMVDTFMNLIVLTARAFSVYLGGFIAVNQDILFSAFYFPLLIAFMLAFRLRLITIVLSGLEIFQKHLSILAVFAAVCYISLISLLDVWGAWEKMHLLDLFKWIALAAFVVVCYIIAFRTLVVIRKQQNAQAENEKISEQLVLSEQYYRALVERIEQVRKSHHDMQHHVNVLKGLCSQERWQELEGYLIDMDDSIPESISRKYCSIGSVNALLNYFAGMFELQAIDFRCRVVLSENTALKPMHLCVIVGNALQNAYEAQANQDPDSHGYVDTCIIQKNGKTVISVSNPCPQKPTVAKTGRFKTSKQEAGHGLGLESIEETAKLYSGWCSADWQDGIFTLQVILNNF